jgi:HD superfamily phosphohydrolase YqeK
MVGRVLYCADYLEPGRPDEPETRAELARRFPADPHGVTVEVARRRLLRLITAGWQLPEPTYRFWNRLVAPSSLPR